MNRTRVWLGSVDNYGKYFEISGPTHHLMQHALLIMDIMA
jgi:hypothetical protein